MNDDLKHKERKGYLPTIGLEIHAELKTDTKMFCNSKNDPDEINPNVNVCPVCMAHPGTLPTINRKAVEHVVRVGVAINGEIADYTEFDRKNYFYPDIPKGYQISQYKYPLVKGGQLDGVEITRIHLEEDTARSVHSNEGGEAGSLLDFNRAGVPLMELVTEPVIHDSKTAAQFARELQLLLRYLDAGEANMEKGEMRVEANISVSKNEDLGTKVEVKNLNSFKSVEKAIEREIERQIGLLERGEKVEQQTRGWDEEKETTFPQRMKEESHDYRYFPDPDLPSLKLSQISIFEKDNILQAMPELPLSRVTRYTKTLGVKEENANLFVRERHIGDFFDQVLEVFKIEKDNLDNLPELYNLSSNYLASDVVGMMEDESFKELTPSAFAETMMMIQKDIISSRGAKDILADIYQMGGDPTEIAEKKGVIQESDRENLKSLADEIIEENQDVVEEYKQGKESALKYLMGQGMKKSKGKANPQILKEILESTIS